MTKAKISQYDATAANNTDVNGVNIAEGCPPSSMNNMGREIMAALKRFQVGSDGDGVTVGGSLVVSGSTTANTIGATVVNASGNATVGGTLVVTGATTFSGNVVISGSTTATTVSTTVVQSDTISEKTSAAGVTIDGVLLKDSAVSAPDGGTFTKTTATTNAVTQVLRIDSQSSGTPANGIGVGLEFATETAAGNTEIGATIETITTDVTSTSEDFDLSFKTMAAGAAAAERFRVKSTGDFQFNSGYGSVATAYGCRAWVNFNGTGAVAIRASGNVSSITDNGTGDYTINFTTAMPDANYSAVAISHTTVTVINTNYSGVAGSIRWACTNYSGTLTDSSIVNVAMFR